KTSKDAHASVATPGSRPKALALRCIFLLNPPHSGGVSLEPDKGSTAATGNSAEDSAFAKVKVEYVVNGSSNAKICVMWKIKPRWLKTKQRRRRCSSLWRANY
ncbi:hypothetical protein PIB30_056633, partial [Stylosanthes scabra]|nr:hypothetical protein [Stylosanthes scabra]